MAVQFQVFADLSAGTTTQTWDDRQIQVRTTFRERTGAWYIDLFELDGTPIVFGRRVSPIFMPLFGLGFEGESLPRGQTLLALGPDDPYLKAALNVTLVLELQSAEEIAEVELPAPQFETFVELL